MKSLPKSALQLYLISFIYLDGNTDLTLPKRKIPSSNETSASYESG